MGCIRLTPIAIFVAVLLT